MDYKKSSLLLKKITSLYTTLQENDDHASAMEKQLMQSYLTDFFDAFVSGNGDTDLFHEATQQVRPPKINLTSQISHAEVTQPPIAPQAITSVAAPVRKSAPEVDLPAVTELPSDVVRGEPIVESTQAPLQKVQNTTEDISNTVSSVQEAAHKNPEAITDKETIVSAKDLISQSITNDVDADLIALFEDNPVNDLSDKLGMLPINDLTRALSINEKFFTIQQLFGGDSKAFEQTLQQLNSLSSFDEASDALMHSVASQYEWAAEAKKKKAEQFIKIVKRRYQS